MTLERGLQEQVLFSPGAEPAGGGLMATRIEDGNEFSLFCVVGYGMVVLLKGGIWGVLVLGSFDDFWIVIWVRVREDA